MGLSASSVMKWIHGDVAFSLSQFPEMEKCTFVRAVVYFLVALQKAALPPPCGPHEIAFREELIRSGCEIAALHAIELGFSAQQVTR